MTNDRDRYRGCLLGLAASDAGGTTAEFRSPGTFEPVTDMTGGGPFALEAGQWTDDTSMALCLAESLIACGQFDAGDQMRRYVRWWREGHLSSTGECFDIGNTIAAALRRFERTDEPFRGSTDPKSAGNGSIMRLAPVPMAYAADPATAIEMAAQSSRTTHGAAACIDACRYLAGLLVGALRGVGKDELLSNHYAPVAGCWKQRPLVAEIAEVAGGSFKHRDPPQIVGSGYVVRSLEAALWAFHRSGDFREGCLLAVNLGDDADTTAAVYGQLAGAYYGLGGIPDAWVQRLAMRERIVDYADRLMELSQAKAGVPLRGEPGLPSRADIAAVLAFRPTLASADFTFGHWTSMNRSPGGMPGMPHYVLSKDAGRLVQTLYERGFIRPGFRWMDWKEQARQLFEDPAALQRADLDTLCKLLTTHVRQDRFCEGHLGAMDERGHLLAILERLAAIHRSTAET